MQCPVCNVEVNNLARHFVSKYRNIELEDTRKHIEYVEKERQLVADFVISLFESDFTLRQVTKLINEKYINLTFKSLRMVCKIWIKKFGQEEYDKRTKRLASLRSKGMWQTRDKNTLKWYENRIQSTKDRTRSANDNTEKILIDHSLTTSLIENVNAFEIKPHLYDSIQCRLCGEFYRNLGFHLIYIHNITIKAYKEIYLNEPVVCQESMDKRSKKLIEQGIMRKIRYFDEDIDVEKEIEIIQYRKKMFKLVRGRDICCQECGKENCKLDVHHIVPDRIFSRYDFEAHDPDNLILLCYECHATIGQQLDDIYLDIFERMIQLMYPLTGWYIIKLLRFEKFSIFKRKVGAPKKYIINENKLNEAKVNGRVIISKAMDLMPDVSKDQILRHCRDNSITYINPECLTKNLKTKICPVAACGWSGSFKFSNHVVNSDDEQHKVFIENLRRLYLDEKLGCEDIAKKYSEFNFTKEIVERILKDAGIYYKILEEVV